MQYYSQNLLGDSYFVYNGNVLRLVRVSCVNHCWHEWETSEEKENRWSRWRNNPRVRAYANAHMLLF